MDKLIARLSGMLNALSGRGALTAVLVGLLPACLFFYVGYIYFIEPAAAQNLALDKKVIALERQVAEGRAVEQSEEQFRLEAKKTVELFYESLPLLPKETEISNVLTGVQSVAGRYNVVLTGLNAGKEALKTANADKLYEREIPATVVGRYDDVMKFFLDLSRQTRILIVRDYAAQSVGAKQRAVRPQFVTVNFSLLAYHAPPTAEFPNLPTGINIDPPPVQSLPTPAVGQPGE